MLKEVNKRARDKADARTKSEHTFVPPAVAAASATNHSELSSKFPPLNSASDPSVHRWIMDELERQGLISRLSIDEFGQIHISNLPGGPSSTPCVDRFGHIQIKNPKGSDAVAPTLAEILTRGRRLPPQGGLP